MKLLVVKADAYRARPGVRPGERQPIHSWRSVALKLVGGGFIAKAAFNRTRTSPRAALDPADKVSRVQLSSPSFWASVRARLGRGVLG